MPTDTKQLTADEVLERLNVIHEFSEDHSDEWRNEVARDLNHLIGRAIYSLETSCDESDIGFSNAALRIVERVVEFEEIKAKGKPEAVWQLNTHSNPFYDQPKCEVMFTDGKTQILLCPKCARGMFINVVKWRSID